VQDVSLGIVGLGNVGFGTLAILAENADRIALQLGLRDAVDEMSELDFLQEAPLALPMETAL
jgi:homoserine dehydrogenase